MMHYHGLYNTQQHLWTDTVSTNFEQRIRRVASYLVVAVRLADSLALVTYKRFRHRTFLTGIPVTYYM